VLSAVLADAARTLVASPLDGAERAFVSVALASIAPSTLVAVFESPSAAEEAARDIDSLLPLFPASARPSVLLLPSAADVAGAAPASSSPALARRLEALSTLLANPPKLLLTSVPALREPAPDPDGLSRRTLSVGDALSPEKLSGELLRDRYAFTPEVVAPAQASQRGGIFDFWAPSAPSPVRVEFFGDTVESLRTFDPATQCSDEKLSSFSFPSAPSADAFSGEATDYFPDGSAFLFLSPLSAFHHFSSSLSGADADDPPAAWARWRRDLARLFRGGRIDAGVPPEGGAEDFSWGLADPGGLASFVGRAIPPDAIAREEARFLDSLRERAQKGWKIGLFLPSAEAAERWRAAHPDLAARGVAAFAGILSGGFACPARKLLLAGESDLYATRRARPTWRTRRAVATDETGARLTDWMDLKPGERVVHLDHGIGKYLGLYEIRVGGGTQEALVIEYAEGAKLYVPTTQAHLLSRYVGGGVAPPLHKLGGRRWNGEKASAMRAAGDLAARLLETQARRRAVPGFAFPPAGTWEEEFARSFPYVETPDQRRAIEDVARDMESARPMDRLVCGDAGYGKTEVAMRAAFKAVCGGKQVAVLAPTTVLAQQHFETFRSRMAAFPVAIDVVSRFRSPAERAATVAAAAAGKVDILIGTHRLLSRDVAFKDLGLVIVDEEQRFGVAAKEHLKNLREAVDVLTLSATPIPRTLYLGLMGARDMSLIRTAPRERLQIETRVAPDSDELVAAAVQREVARGGQVFFLHNRVQTMGIVEARLRRILPGIRIGVGHGQMEEKALAETMRAFIRGEYDLLLCTTIIGSGVDIPSVNTLLVDRADRFGMADLYQIRGRVGRSGKQAYAYLLLPRHGGLYGAARERIAALRKHSALGAGYKLALRDLELRGAGSVLGAAQSGHIASVGFELYCQLIARSVARLKGEPERPIIEVEARLDFLTASPEEAEAERAAVIPRDYVEEENQRIAVYRRIAECAYEREVDSLAAELRDRFGPIPKALARLLEVTKLKIVAAGLGLRRIETEGNILYLKRAGDRYLMVNGRHLRLHRHGTDERLDEISRKLRALAHAGSTGARE
jgi:transcription-repair coupling factor (superfamily II helicase)